MKFTYPNDVKSRYDFKKFFILGLLPKCFRGYTVDIPVKAIYMSFFHEYVEVQHNELIPKVRICTTDGENLCFNRGM